MIARVQPTEQLDSAASAAWRPLAIPRPSDWTPAAFRLSSDYEASAGPYDLGARPWWRDVLDLYDDPAVREVDIMASTQVGKTLAVIASILWVAEHQPAPGLVCLPDQGAAIEFRDRVYANVEASQRRGGLQRITTPPEHLRNTRWIDLGTMRVYLAWSGARQRLRGRACRYVWLSEVDVYRGDKRAGDPIAAADQRVKSFWRFLLWRESSPREYPSAIAGLEETATARLRWWADCPHCGASQLVKFFPERSGPNAGRGGFGGLADDQGNWLAPEDARRHAHYVCINGCRIEEHDKATFVEAGRWVPIGQRVEDGKITGRPPRSWRKIGVHLWAIHSDVIGWADIAAAHADARQQGTLAEFFGNWLGLPFRSETRIPSWKQIGRRLAWPNSRGEVPAEAWFLTAGADVQDRAVYWVVRAWAPLVTSWLVDWGCFERAEEDETELVKSDLAQLGGLLNRRFAVLGENPLGRTELAVKLLGIDSNYRPMDVHNWMRSLPEEWLDEEGGTERVRAFRGDHKLDPQIPFRRRVVERNTRTGEEYEGGLRQWGVYVYHFYSDLAERLAGEPAKAGSWHVTQDALKLGKPYLQQVANFHRVVELNNRGRRRVIWRPRSNMIAVDYWDTEVYGLVAAHMVVGDLGWSPSAWDAWREQSQRQKRRRRPREAAEIAAR